MAITKMTTNNVMVRMQRKGNTLAQLLGFPGGSMVKNLPATAGNARKDPWVRKIPWRRKWQPTLSSILAWKIPWTKKLGGL